MPANLFGSFVHAEEAEAEGTAVAITIFCMTNTLSIILDGKADLILFVIELDVGFAGLGVAQNVGEGFLADAEYGGFGFVGDGLGLTNGRYQHIDSGGF
jgi:hypothetical protein